MTYVLEEMSVDDKKKVLADVSRDDQLRNRFDRLGIASDRPIRWAVDRINDSYLFKVSADRELGNAYQFFFGGEMFFVVVSDSAEINWKRKTKIYRSGYRELMGIGRKIKDGLSMAFEVYGKNGFGASDKYGPSDLYKVIPVFGEED